MNALSDVRADASDEQWSTWGRTQPANPTDAQPFVALALRQVLGACVTGLTMITALDSDGKPHGPTANSFCPAIAAVTSAGFRGRGRGRGRTAPAPAPAPVRGGQATTERPR